MSKVIELKSASQPVIEKGEAVEQKHEAEQGKAFVKHAEVVRLPRRVGWAGLSEEEAERQGAPLLAMLYQRANEDGLQLKELAAVLNVTYGYIHQLKTGLREVSAVSDEFVASCAAYLNKPRMYVHALAGKLNLADFYEPDSLDGELEAAMSLMYKDSQWGGFMPLSLKSLGTRERLFLVKLYEAATGKVLIPKVTVEDLAKV